ncbi:MAG: YfcE family phosphodiesterase [Gemmataceae bacterium]
MKIAILSDSHDSLARVSKALTLARGRGAELVIHCGDITSPTVVHLFEGWPAHFVLGNCDWDRAALAEAIAGAGATLHENFGHLEIDGKALAFLHGHEPGLMADLLQSGAYDYLFHGHTHVAIDQVKGATRVINPGALQRAAVKTFAVLDPATGQAESVVVE